MNTRLSLLAQSEIYISLYLINIVIHFSRRTQQIRPLLPYHSPIKKNLSLFFIPYTNCMANGGNFNAL